ncbi:MAG: phosphatase PAP2 family protein [Patescibacteria group bacterium]
MPQFDHKIAKQIFEMGQSQVKFWVFISKFGLYIFLATLILIAFLINANGAVVFWLIPPASAFFITFVVRYVVRRPRPKFAGNEYVPLLKKWSFPSAHAGVAYAFATTLSLIVFEVDFVIGIVCAMVFFLMANLISLSRLALGVHYFSDVLAGALIGMVISVMLISI